MGAPVGWGLGDCRLGGLRGPQYRLVGMLSNHSNPMCILAAAGARGGLGHWFAAAGAQNGQTPFFPFFKGGCKLLLAHIGNFAQTLWRSWLHTLPGTPSLLPLSAGERHGDSPSA